MVRHQQGCRRRRRRSCARGEGRRGGGCGKRRHRTPQPSSSSPPPPTNVPVSVSVSCRHTADALPYPELKGDRSGQRNSNAAMDLEYFQSRVEGVECNIGWLGQILQVVLLRWMGALYLGMGEGGSWMKLWNAVTGYNSGWMIII